MSGVDWNRELCIRWGCDVVWLPPGSALGCREKKKVRRELRGPRRVSPTEPAEFADGGRCKVRSIIFRGKSANPRVLDRGRPTETWHWIQASSRIFNLQQENHEKGIKGAAKAKPHSSSHVKSTAHLSAYLTKEYAASAQGVGHIPGHLTSHLLKFTGNEDKVAIIVLLPPNQGARRVPDAEKCNETNCIGHTTQTRDRPGTAILVDSMRTSPSPAPKEKRKQERRRITLAWCILSQIRVA